MGMAIRITSQGWAFTRWSFRLSCVLIAAVRLGWLLYDCGTFTQIQHFAASEFPSIGLPRRSIQITGIALPIMLLLCLSGHLFAFLKGAAAFVTVRRICAV